MKILLNILRRNILLVGGIFGIGEIVNGSPNKSWFIIPVLSKSKLLTGGDFGVETAVPAIIGYLIVSVLCFGLYKRRDLS